MSEVVASLDAARASEASPKLRLKIMLLLEVHAKAHGLPPTGANLGFSLAQAPAVWNVVGDSLIALYSLDLRIEDRRPSITNPVADLSVAIRAEYTFKPEFRHGVDEHLLDHYVGIVGRMHAWPYFRAEIQTLTAKLSLPPLTLPVLMSGDMAKLPVARFAEQISDIEQPEKPRVQKPRSTGTRAKKGSTRSATKTRRRART